MNKILFVDTLTTGLNTERCAIYRFGGILCEETVCGMKEILRFEYAIKPCEGARIMENSLWTGGVTRAELYYYPDQAKVFLDFFKMIQEHVNIRNPRDKMYIAGFNAAAFDVPFIKHWFETNDSYRFRDCFYVQTIDLMSLAAFALLNQRENMPDFYLETAAKYLGVNPTKSEKYSCLDNADTCLKMYVTLKTLLHTGEGGVIEKTDNVIRNYRI